ncbi:protein FAR-RED IMPAIRED RESPONSE 1-like [Camellia sinensis]|uniref:protein FAR-RED IMPAIRED RESPONSE 1-like n=1 Tax=Camellia sinensis TaxID=4442 RepID=UPI0010356563|nr:protein FAR-RED IMPAIRED RESPONSE 1-like [Camellia sinensis]
MDIDSNNPSLNGSKEVKEAGNNPSLNEIGEVEEPKKGMCFSSKQEVYSFYAKYVKHLGFAVAYRTQNIGQDGEVKYCGIECTRARKRTKRSEVHHLEPSLSSFIECKAKRRLEINDEAGIWVARNFYSIVVEAGGYEALTFDERDARHHIQSMRKLRLEVGDAESVALYFYRMQQQNSNFHSAIDLDEDGRMRNLFWADVRSRATYKAFGDVTSAELCKMPLKLSFHNLNIVGAMQNAIEVVFPQSQHRWCLWHIMKKIPEKLRGYAQYEFIKFALQNAIYDCFTKDEFDKEWQAMIAKFKLDDNEWLGYDNALRSKVEKEMKADFKSRNKLYECLTVYVFKKQFHAAYTNTKFKEVQVEVKLLLYCRANLVKDEGEICTYHVNEVVLVGEKTKTVEFVVYFNASECELHCMCPSFEFKGIMYAHAITVLLERCIYQVPDKYIVQRWRKDIERGYTYISTIYTKAWAVLNAKLHDKYHKMLDEIIEITANNDGKHEVLDLGLIEIKDRVRKN